MTHVSKIRIGDEGFKKIYKQLIKLVEKSGSNKNGSEFLKELFSTAEKVMFAKRIGIVVMIHEKIPDRKIAEAFSVSTSTIGRMLEKYDRGDYKYILSVMAKEKFEIGKILEFLLTGILPPRAGRGQIYLVK